LCLLLASLASAQQKRPLTHDDYDGWRSIAGTTTDASGTWIAYSLTPQDGDAVLEVRRLEGDTVYKVPRGTSPRFTEDGKFLVFTVQPAKEEVKAHKRSKLKKEKESGGQEGASA
jgi:hypothetical protein